MLSRGVYILYASVTFLYSVVTNKHIFLIFFSNWVATQF